MLVYCGLLLYTSCSDLRHVLVAVAYHLSMVGARIIVAACLLRWGFISSTAGLVGDLSRPAPFLLDVAVFVCGQVGLLFVLGVGMVNPASRVSSDSFTRRAIGVAVDDGSAGQFPTLHDA